MSADRERMYNEGDIKRVTFSKVLEPKNLYVQPMDMNYGGGNDGGSGRTGWRGIKGRKKIGQL